MKPSLFYARTLFCVAMEAVVALQWVAREAVANAEF